MAVDRTLVQLPNLLIPSTGSKTYALDGAQSYQATIDAIMQVAINQYGIFTSPVNSTLMTVDTAQVILEGLNNATTAKLSTDRIDFDFEAFESAYFDIDGGTFFDTYSNSTTFDGGNF